MLFFFHLEHPRKNRGVVQIASSLYRWARFLAAQHLIEHGHTDIAVVGLDDTVSICRQHADGVRLAVQQSSVPVRSRRWIVDAFSPSAGREAVINNMKSASDRPH